MLSVIELGVIRLYFAHDAEEVLSPEFLYLLFGEPLGTEPSGEVDDLRGIGAAYDASVAVEVGAYAYMVDTCNFYHVADVAHGIIYGGSTLLA